MSPPPVLIGHRDELRLAQHASQGRGRRSIRGWLITPK